VNKAAGLLTYRIRVKLSTLRSVDEILKHIAQTSGTMKGMFSTYYWAIYAMVFLYDKMKTVLLKVLSSQQPSSSSSAEKAIENVAVRASHVFLKLNEAA
jgi:hypothetical protein